MAFLHNVHWFLGDLIHGVRRMNGRIRRPGDIACSLSNSIHNKMVFEEGATFEESKMSCGLTILCTWLLRATNLVLCQVCFLQAYFPKHMIYFIDNI